MWRMTLAIQTTPERKEDGSWKEWWVQIPSQFGSLLSPTLHSDTAGRVLAPCEHSFSPGWCYALSLTCAIGQATVARVLDGLVVPAASTGALLAGCCGWSGWTTWMSVRPAGSKYKTDISYHEEERTVPPPKSPYSLSHYLWEISPVIVLLVFDLTEAGPKRRNPGKLPSW